jgi:hypothetical protein
MQEEYQEEYQERGKLRAAIRKAAAVISPATAAAPFQNQS